MDQRGSAETYVIHDTDEEKKDGKNAIEQRDGMAPKTHPFGHKDKYQYERLRNERYQQIKQIDCVHGRDGIINKIVFTKHDDNISKI